MLGLLLLAIMLLFVGFVVPGGWMGALIVVVCSLAFLAFAPRGRRSEGKLSTFTTGRESHG